MIAESEYTVEDHAVSVEGGEIRVRSVVPKGGEDLPLLVWFHGGGERTSFDILPYTTSHMRHRVGSWRPRYGRLLSQDSFGQCQYFYSQR